MSSITEKIIEAIRTLPEQQVIEVLDFAEYLQAKTKQQQSDRKKEALAILDKHAGLYNGEPVNREELHERP